MWSDNFLRDLGQHHRDLPPGELKRNAQRAEACITFGVGFLARNHPSPAIRALMALTYELLGAKVVEQLVWNAPLPNGQPIETVHFLVVSKGQEKKLAGALLFPLDYADRTEKAPFFHLGGLVYVASQVADFWSDKFSVATARQDSRDAYNRARIHEAEYLIGLTGVDPLNKYQRGVVAEYPQGVATPKAESLLYTHKSFT